MYQVFVSSFECKTTNYPSVGGSYALTLRVLWTMSLKLNLTFIAPEHIYDLLATYTQSILPSVVKHIQSHASYYFTMLNSLKKESSYLPIATSCEFVNQSRGSSYIHSDDYSYYVHHTGKISNLLFVIIIRSSLIVYVHIL